MSAHCHDCHAEYGTFGADLVLPDQQWKALTGGRPGMILCPTCICKRAARFGGTALLSWVDNLDYAKAKEAAPCP